MTTRTYCFVNSEFDGLAPSIDSILSFSCAACSEDGVEISEFMRRLLPLECAAQNPRTMSWWKTESEAWATTQTDQISPDIAMTAFIEWVRALPGDVVFAAAP